MEPPPKLNDEVCCQYQTLTLYVESLFAYMHVVCLCTYIFICVSFISIYRARNFINLSFKHCSQTTSQNRIILHHHNHQRSLKKKELKLYNHYILCYQMITLYILKMILCYFVLVATIYVCMYVRTIIFIDTIYCTIKQISIE